MVPVPGVIEVEHHFVAQHTHARKHTSMILSSCEPEGQAQDIGAADELQFNELVPADLPAGIAKSLPAIAKRVLNAETEVDHFFACRCLRNSATSLLALCSTAE